MSAYLEALNRIAQPVRRGEYPDSLAPMHALLAALGDPHNTLPAVVVAGSTGKGTTCTRISQMLRVAGLHVGLYTSPHLHSFRERFVLDDAMIDQAAFVTGAAAVSAAAQRVGHAYSTFEQATALALWWFAQQRPDVVVLEVGLGGRWDAVNVVNNLLAVFAPIEAEHVAMLGGSLDSVARHKAGIIKPGGHAVTVPQVPPVHAVLADEARQQQAALHIATDVPLAVAACRNLYQRGFVPAVPEGEASAMPPGRLEYIRRGERGVLIDGGHTPAAARFLLAEIERLAAPGQPVRLIIGLLNDKDAAGYLEVFDSPQFHIVLTRAPGHRAADPHRLHRQHPLQQAAVVVEPDLSQALAQIDEAPEPLVVVAGSLRLAAITREACGLLSEAMQAEAHATRAIFEGASYLAKLDSRARKA